MSDAKEDPDYALKIEKAIIDKFGADAVQHPAKNWTPEKEKEYIEELKKLTEKMNKLSEKTEKIEVRGVLISKKLLNKDSNRVCSVCDVYTFNTRDDVYVNKYSCCYECYIQWVDGREERWATGWRPNKGK